MHAHSHIDTYILSHTHTHIRTGSRKTSSSPSVASSAEDSKFKDSESTNSNNQEGTQVVIVIDYELACKLSPDEVSGAKVFPLAHTCMLHFLHLTSCFTGSKRSISPIVFDDNNGKVVII